MRLCPRCGGTHEGLTCPPGDVPREEGLNAVIAIEQKINRTRFRNSRVTRWAFRGARYGFVIAIILGQIMAVGMLVNGAPRSPGVSGQAVLMQVLAGVLVTALCGTVVGMAAGVLAVGVIRPVWIALFRSIDEWEREYGDRRPRLPPLGPPAHGAG